MGPLLGSLIAVIFYRLIKVLEYETANPGQDFNDQEADVFKVDEDNAATGDDVQRPNPEDLRALSHRNTEEDNAPGHGVRGPEGMGSRPATRDAQGRQSRDSMQMPLGSAGRRDPSGTRRSYHAGPDAERGELGGRYTVSGLRA